MARLSDDEIEAIARRIAEQIAARPARSVAAAAGQEGVFTDVGAAIRAAAAAQPKLVSLPLDRRRIIIRAIRETMLENAAALAKSAHEETGLGRFEDKIVKNQLVSERTPGVEDLSPVAYTGDHGLTLVEPAPFGVIGSITPCTNPTSTIICNSIGMLAAGNAVVFNPHPAAKRCSVETIRLLNRCITAAGGPPDAVTTVAEPTIATAQELMKHPGVRLLVVTGGGGVVKAAMESGKRAICAGPGNPPVVVDETADIEKAARDIVLGASTDNNIICVDEKEVLVVDAVAGRLLEAMKKNDAVVLDRTQTVQIENLVFKETRGPRRPGVVNREFIGKNADEILARAGIRVPSTVRLAVAEVPEDHPLVWTEQMMPVLPVVRVPDADYAIRLAVEAEGGNRHTFIMHSRNLDNLSRMAKECNASIFVKNGRAQAGLGLGGEGYCSFTIASPTGEGLTGPRTFSRWRRCVLVDHFRIT
ncbi:MAG TPA: aldehyde dehydrogenase EutE [Kiritimatiellae bacterium]|nr:aldehyde dehydrogenase EutE [Kiritimatiellia bacterium]